MRTRTRTTHFIALASATLLAALPAHARSFPDGGFHPFLCQDGSSHRRMWDDAQDVPTALDERDLVGNEDAPAGLHSADADALYLRMRLDRNPIPDAGITDGAWGFVFGKDPNGYSGMVRLESASGRVAVYRNTSVTIASSPADPPDSPPLHTYDIGDAARVVAAPDSNFDGNTDWFLDFAIPWADLEDLDLDHSTSGYVWGATSSGGTELDGDVTCNGAGGGLGGSHLSVLDPADDVNDDGVVDGDGSGDTLRLAGGAGCSAGPGSVSGLLLVLAVASVLRRRGW